MRKQRLAAIVLTAGALVTAACGGGKEVGDKDLLGQAGNNAGTARLGEATTTTHPAAAVTTTPARVTNTTARPTATTAAKPQAAALSLTINGDSQAKPAFDPPAGRIYRGTCAKWTNNDSKARSVVADGGQFDSGPIAPGASWTFCGDAPGKFAYHDGTRPYAVGTIEVINR